MTAAVNPRGIKALTRMEGGLWKIFAVGLAIGVSLLGLNYGIGGDKSASAALDTVRHLMSISSFGVATLVTGILLFATINTRWIVVTLWIAFGWAAIAATLVAIGAYEARQGGAGVVLFGIFIAPPALILMLTAPDKSLLFALFAWIERRREGRGGAA